MKRDGDLKTYRLLFVTQLSDADVPQRYGACGNPLHVFQAVLPRREVTFSETQLFTVAQNSEMFIFG
jgi:hypothetical protein